MSAKRPTWLDFINDLGPALREYRHEASMNAEEIAKNAGVGPNTIYRMERGEMPSTMTLACVMDALGVEAPRFIVYPSDIENQRLRKQLRKARTQVRVQKVELRRLEKLRRGEL